MLAASGYRVKFAGADPQRGPASGKFRELLRAVRPDVERAAATFLFRLQEPLF